MPVFVMDTVATILRSSPVFDNVGEESRRLDNVKDVYDKPNLREYDGD